MKLHPKASAPKNVNCHRVVLGYPGAPSLGTLAVPAVWQPPRESGEVPHPEEVKCCRLQSSLLTVHTTGRLLLQGVLCDQLPEKLQHFLGLTSSWELQERWPRKAGQQRSRCFAEQSEVEEKLPGLGESQTISGPLSWPLFSPVLYLTGQWFPAPGYLQTDGHNKTETGPRAHPLHHQQRLSTWFEANVCSVAP